MSATSSNERDSGCCSSDTRRRAEVVDDALLAVRHPCDADAPAVPDQQVREAAPVLARHEPDQIALDLDRILLTRQPQALRQPPDVRVHDDPLRSAELRGNDVGGLPRDAGQAYELLELS